MKTEFEFGFKEIDINDIKGLSIGHASNEEAGTGVTVLYFENGAQVGCDISGGGPASRETPLTSPVTAPNPINTIVLSGGSAYGLAAADGVMNCLEEHGIGFDTGFSLVPLVCQSCIFDLGYKSAKRPDANMGREACENALKKERVAASGCVGAATGATVGKMRGMENASKTGLGTYAVQVGDLQLAAIVVVNALGNIVDPTTGEVVTGMKGNKAANEGEFASVRGEAFKLLKPTNLFTGNTTIGAIITNAKFSKAELTKIASMTRNGYARTIYPVGTLADGDTIYVASVGDVEVDLNMLGSLAAYAMEKAVIASANYEE